MKRMRHSDWLLVAVVWAGLRGPLAQTPGVRNLPEPNAEAQEFYDTGAGLLRFGDPARAADAFAEAVRLAPDRVDWKRQWARALRAGGQPARAAEVLAPLSPALGSDASFQHQWGLCLLQAGNPEDAKTHVFAAVGLKPFDPIYQNTMGMVQAALGQNEKALASFRRALQLDADLHEARYNLALSLYRTGAWDEALKQLRLFQTRTGGSIGAQILTAACCLKLGKPKDALAILEEARRKDERNFSAGAWKLLGMAYGRNGMGDAALQALNRSVELDPDRAWTWVLIGVEHGLAGRSVQSMEAIHKALELEPGDRFILHQYALALARAGDIAQAQSICADLYGSDSMEDYRTLSEQISAQASMRRNIDAAVQEDVWRSEWEGWMKRTEADWYSESTYWYGDSGDE